MIRVLYLILLPLRIAWLVTRLAGTLGGVIFLLLIVAIVLTVAGIELDLFGVRS